MLQAHMIQNCLMVGSLSTACAKGARDSSLPRVQCFFPRALFPAPGHKRHAPFETLCLHIYAPSILVEMFMCHVVKLAKCMEFLFRK